MSRLPFHRDYTRYWINANILYENTFNFSDLAKQNEVCELLSISRQETLRRYATHGRKSPITDKLVKLEVAFDVSGHMLTSIEAVYRFLERFNGSRDTPDVSDQKPPDNAVLDDADD